MQSHALRRWFGIASLCVIVATVAVFEYCQDLEQPGDTDLSLVSERVPAEQNALIVLSEATRLLVYPADHNTATDRIDLAIIGASWDDAWSANLLEENASALEQFAHARALPEFQIRVQTVQGEGQALGSWLMLAKLRALEARAQSLEGDLAGALDASLSLARFGARIRALDGGRMVHYLTGTSIIRIALGGLQRILKNADIEPQLALRVVDEIGSLRMTTDGWAQVVRGDYQWNKALLDESVAARGATEPTSSRDPFAREVLESMVSMTPEHYSLQRNRTLERLANHYRATLSGVASSCLSLELAADQPDVRPRAASATSVERNSVGNYWADLTRVSIDVYRQTSCVSESLLSAVQVMVALRAFEVREGHMPLDLGTLVPEFITSIPLDYFDGKPIRYSADQHLIYSVGSDFADANGQWKPGEPCNSELRFPIPFATATQSVALPTRFTCAAPRS